MNPPVVRLLTTDLDPFVEEDNAVLHAGLISAPFVTVDDTGAKHVRRNAFTTQIGGERFSIFRTSSSKSRLNFLSILRAGHQDYVFNEEAVGWLRSQGAEQAIMAKLKNNVPAIFPDQITVLEHLASKGIDIVDRQLMRLLAEAAMWGAIRHHGLLGKTVIVSDDAGKFRVANHALCWVHAERLLQKLMPATPKQERLVTMVRDLVWRFYKALKAWKQKPSPQAVSSFHKRFDRIFTLRTGYEALDKLLVRLHRRRDELLKVLEHPRTPLHTNASENDIRSFVTRRKISGGTMSLNGRIARDVMLGLLKTCQKLGISFYHFLGDRLGLRSAGQAVPPLSQLVMMSSENQAFLENATSLPLCNSPARFSFRSSCGETFHWRPLSPCTVTVLRFRRMTIPACVWPPLSSNTTRSPIASSSKACVVFC